MVIDRTEHNSQLEDSPQLYFSWVKEWNPHLLILEEDEILFLGLSTLLGMSFLYCEQKTNMAWKPGETITCLWAPLIVKRVRVPRDHRQANVTCLKWNGQRQLTSHNLSEQLNFKKARSSYCIQNIWLWSGKCTLELCSIGRRRIPQDSSLASIRKIWRKKSP